MRTLIWHNQFFDSASCLYRAPVYPEITSSLGERAIMHCHTSQTLYAIESKASISKGTEFSYGTVPFSPQREGSPAFHADGCPVLWKQLHQNSKEEKKNVWLNEKIKPHLCADQNVIANFCFPLSLRSAESNINKCNIYKWSLLQVFE